MESRNTLLIAIILLFSSYCEKKIYNPKLPEYLRAEKKLRNRIAPEQGLEDSILMLKKNYRIDLEQEFKKFKDNPELWQKLLKELSNGR